MSYLLAKGESIRPVFRYKVGVKFRSLIEDAKNLHSTLKGGPKLVSMEPVKRLKAVLRFLKFYEKDLHYDGFTLLDPLPFFADQMLSWYAATKEMIRG